MVRKAYTKDDIRRMIAEENVEFLRLQFSDVFGTIKNVEVPVSQLEKVLDNNLMFDGSSIEGFVRIEESDMYLYPDLSTFMIRQMSCSACLTGTPKSRVLLAVVIKGSRVKQK